MRRLRMGLLALLVTGVTVELTSAQRVDSDLRSLVQGNTEFGLALYQRLAKEDGNLFLSPYSISNAFGMCYAGARGNTAAQMKDVLRFKINDERLHPVFGKLISQLHGQGKKQSFQLTIANRLWGQKGYGFLPEFTKLSSDHYGAGLEEVNFSGDTEAARSKINHWVEERTNQKIKDLIPAGVLNDKTRLVLTNAIYFKAAWAKMFDKNQTKPGDFRLASGKTVRVPMMHNSERLQFASLGEFSMVSLMYENYQQSMWILLPNKADGLPALEKQLTAENLTRWSEKLSDHMVDLALPKFRITSEFNLNENLKALGMKDAFDPNRADFTGLATSEQLFISAVLHKAFVDVNEMGTEAAAATAIAIGATSLPPPATFHADRPFVFVIRDNTTGTILFLGRVVNPS